MDNLVRSLDPSSATNTLLNMMHAVSQHGSMSMSAPHGYPMAPPGAHSDGGAPTSAASVDSENRKHDISEILQQIMNITDQSLDEAQARSVTVPQGLVNTFVYPFYLYVPYPANAAFSSCSFRASARCRFSCARCTVH